MAENDTRVPPGSWSAERPPQGENEHKESPPKKKQGDRHDLTDEERARKSADEQKREADRDEVLRESFPASDPPPVSPGSE